MEKTVSATEAKNRFGALLGELDAPEDAVIIESRGVATAALIPMERFIAFKKLEDEDRMRRAYEDLLKLRAEIAEQTKDLSEQEIDALIDEINEDIKADRRARFRALREKRTIA